MSIEFRCAQCGRLLRTPEGTTGRQAKCPQCGALSTIPEVSSAVQTAMAGAAADLPHMSPAPESLNPYRSPAAGEMRSQGEIRRGFNSTRIDIGDVMSRAWQIYKERLWPCVGVYLLFAVVGNVPSQVISYLMRNADALPAIALFTVNIAISTFLTIGLMTYMFRVARGEETSVADLFSGGPLLLPALGITILFTVATTIGFILLIVPGIIVLFMFSQSFYVLIDQRTGVIDSMRLSAQATRGNKLILFVLALVSVGLTMMGFLALCIGIFFVAPYVMLMSAVAYLAMTGQSTAADRLQPVG